jgi:hypothetical protein
VTLIELEHDVPGATDCLSFLLKEGLKALRSTQGTGELLPAIDRPSSLTRKKVLRPIDSEERARIMRVKRNPEAVQRT